MSLPVATLPMYDFPAIRAETDRFWTLCRDAFAARGIPAPEHLTRREDYATPWTDPGLVLGQTCGLPFVTRLEGRVTLLGAPDYGVEGCPPGWYRSAVVVRGDDPRDSLAAFRGTRFALNGADSQSGHAAMAHHVAEIAEGAFFGSAEVTGSHAASVRAVAEGRADIAAIDAVSWSFFLRLLPEARALRVLMQTDPTPGLPYISAAGTEPGPHRAAVAEAIAALDADTRATLGLCGFVAMEPADYALLRARFRAALMRVTLVQS